MDVPPSNEGDIPAWEKARKALDEIKGENKNDMQINQQYNQYPPGNQMPFGGNNYYNQQWGNNQFGGYQPYMNGLRPNNYYNNMSYSPQQQQYPPRNNFCGGNQYGNGYNSGNNNWTSFHEPPSPRYRGQFPGNRGAANMLPSEPRYPRPVPPPSSYADAVKNDRPPPQPVPPPMPYNMNKPLGFPRNNKQETGGIRFNIDTKPKFHKFAPPLPKESPTIISPRETTPPPGTEEKVEETKNTPTPTDKPESKDDNAKNPQASWPPTLMEYIQRAFQACTNEQEKDQTEMFLKTLLNNKMKAGSAHSIDWSKEPLPVDLLKKKNTSSRWKQMSQQKDVRNTPPWQRFSDQRRVSRRYSKSRSRSRSRSRSHSPKRRRFHDSDSSSSGSSSHASESHRRSPEFIITKSAHGRGRVVNRGGKGRGRGGINTPDKVTPTKRGKKKNKNKKAPVFMVDDPQKELKKASRANRFQNTFPQRKAKFELSINNYDNSEYNLEDVQIVGSCQDILKDYFRLTAAPDPSTVRPVHILRTSLVKVKEDYREKKDYLYTCRQMKSIRQDLTVQGVRNTFTVEVYETHARIALEKGDHEEFNQCQNQLRQLYKEGVASNNRTEFLAYSILYYVYTKNTTDLTSVLSSITLELRKDECISHSLAVRDAWSAGNYYRFFKLYQSAPKMGGYLMDKFAPRERKLALQKIVKAFKPDVSLTYITNILAFPDRDECMKYLTELEIILTPDKEKVNCKIPQPGLA